MTTYASVISICSFLTAFAITLFGIPTVIKIAYIKKLYDKPGGRKTHKGYVPNLGGIGIFAAFFISYIAWVDFSSTDGAQYLLLGLIVLHFIGVKDDIVPLIPYKKLVGQLLAAVILVVPGKIRITDFHGILGIHELPLPLSIVLGIFMVIVIINSFNLIDGIDGLAASISLIIALTFSYAFWIHGEQNALIPSLALSGAMLGFLYFNKEPAKIFMGDAGSMGIGYLMAAFSFQFVNITTNANQNLFHHNPAIIIAILIIPLFDTLRVFTLRILKKQSPFIADCNHIHHKLLDLGISHRMATYTLCTVNILFIGVAYLLKGLSPNIFICVIVGLAALLANIPALILRNRNKSKKIERPAFQIITELKHDGSSMQIQTKKKPAPQELHLN